VLFTQLWQLQQHSTKETTTPPPETKLIRAHAGLGWHRLAEEGFKAELLKAR